MSTLRHLEEKDHQPIVQIVDEWWGGRPMAGLLPRLFFEHFQPTSFVIEEEGMLQGFLVGFRSQTHPAQAYIHFVGINPQQRGRGLGRQLYEHFFALVRSLDCTEVHCITSPVNKNSIAFHTSMGFEILPGNAEVDSVAITTNYDGLGESRVCFRRWL